MGGSHTHEVWDNTLLLSLYYRDASAIGVVAFIDAVYNQIDNYRASLNVWNLQCFNEHRDLIVSRCHLADGLLFLFLDSKNWSASTSEAYEGSKTVELLRWHDVDSVNNFVYGTRMIRVGDCLINSLHEHGHREILRKSSREHSRP